MDMKAQFPIFQTHSDLVYLDNASTTQRPESVLQAMDHYYRVMNANVHRGLYPLSEQATGEYEGVREQLMRFLNASSMDEIIFTRGTTESLNLVAQCWGRSFLKPGDEILLTLLEHHSNIVPWQRVAQATGAVLKFCPLTESGDLDYEAFRSLLSERTKIVSVTALSNTLGTVVDLRSIISAAHGVGAVVCVDAAQSMAHFPMDVRELEVDFLAFSGHKIYGPTGVGVLYGKRKWLEQMEPWLGGGNMIKEVFLDHSTWKELPWKFEAGTPPIAEVIGLGAALEFIEKVHYDWIEKHDRELEAYAFKALGELPYVTVLGPQTRECHRAVISFTMTGVHPHDVASILGMREICVRAGHHCTMPLMNMLKVPSTTRLSFGVYNTMEDVDRLVEGIKEVAKKFRV